MNKKPVQPASLTKPILSDLIARSKAQAKATIVKISTAPLPSTDQSALYQDPGSGYRANFVFPQD